MNKQTFLGLLFLSTTSFVFAEEYISDDYYREVLSESEIIYEEDEFIPIVDMSESLPIAKTVEEIARDKMKTEALYIEIDSPSTFKEEQSIQAHTYESALEQAKNEDKVIMLTIRSTNCKYCDKMEATTLSDLSVKDAIEANFINIHYNQDLAELPLNLQNGATPMFIFVNSNGDILNMYPGMRSPKEFKEVLEEILTQ
jgi:thiol-disulfide isomerase/thioredoxin